eukprot:GHVO01068096.1.p1 GENE.GHVO01068096.1~~GHVO01068096.1.p1  ORF type:complete len:100 (-),score=5.39 GHVO01068096.1:268-567(-)
MHVASDHGIEVINSPFEGILGRWEAADHLISWIPMHYALLEYTPTKTVCDLVAFSKPSCGLGTLNQTKVIVLEQPDFQMQTESCMESGTSSRVLCELSL